MQIIFFTHIILIQSNKKTVYLHEKLFEMETYYGGTRQRKLSIPVILQLIFAKNRDIRQ